MDPADNLTTNPSTGVPGGLGATPGGSTSASSDFSTAGAMNPSQDSSATESPAITTDAPEDPTPFVPAAPAPGSIGSVTSGPAIEPMTNLAAAVAPSGMDGGAMFAPVNEANPMMPQVENNNLVAQAANEAPAGGAEYNPFATTPVPQPVVDPAQPTMEAPQMAPGAPATENPMMATPNPVTMPSPMVAPADAGAAQPSQSATMPAASAAPSPFQARMDSLAANPRPKAQGGSNVLTIIFAVIGAVAIIAAIVFCVLWRQAVNNPQIRYITTPTTGEVNGGSVLTCSRVQGAEDAPGMENLLNIESSLTLNFANDEWQTSNLLATYNFVDEVAAIAANENVFNAMTSLRSLRDGSGEVITTASSQPLENRVEYREDVDIDMIDGETAAAYGNIPLLEDGSVQKNRDAVQAYYESQGWTCR